jgi:ATP adenylyltransferase
MHNVLWAPWRIQYIMSDKDDGCIFCDKPRQRDDATNLILWRGKTGFVVMNLYPYNNGHLMIVPYAHVPSLTDLDAPQRAELFGLTAACEAILRQTLRPDGFNIGLNLGAAAGAGFADHLHIHIVPRWTGDTNFMPVLGELRVIPEHIKQTYGTLVPHFHDLRPETFAS